MIFCNPSYFNPFWFRRIDVSIVWCCSAKQRSRRETAGLFQQSEGIARTGGSHSRGMGGYMRGWGEYGGVYRKAYKQCWSQCHSPCLQWRYLLACCSFGKWTANDVCNVYRDNDMWGFDFKFNNVWAYDKTDDILPAGSASLLLYHRRYTRQGFPLLILVVFFVESHVYVLSLLFPRPGWIYFPPFPHFTCNLFLPSWLFLGLTIHIVPVQPSATRIQLLSILREALT